MYYLQAGEEEGLFVMQTFYTYQSLIDAIHSLEVQDAMEAALEEKINKEWYETKE